MGMGRPIGTRGAIIDPQGRVQCACWCQHDLLWVPLEWIGARTATCGRRGCEPPRQVAS